MCANSNFPPIIKLFSLFSLTNLQYERPQYVGHFYLSVDLLLKQTTRYQSLNMLTLLMRYTVCTLTCCEMLVDIRRASMSDLWSLSCDGLRSLYQ